MKQLNSKQFTKILCSGDGNAIPAGNFAFTRESKITPKTEYNYLEELDAAEARAIMTSVPDGLVWYCDSEVICDIEDDETVWGGTSRLFFKLNGKLRRTKGAGDAGVETISYDCLNKNLSLSRLQEIINLIMGDATIYSTDLKYNTGKLGKPIPTVVTHFLTLDNNDMIILWNTTASPLNSKEANMLLKKTHYAPVVLPEDTNPGTNKTLYTEFDTITVVKDDYYTAEMTSKRAIANDLDWHLGIGVYETDEGHKQYSLPHLFASQKDSPIGSYMWLAQINDKDNYGFGINDGSFSYLEATGTINWNEERRPDNVKGWEVIA